MRQGTGIGERPSVPACLAIHSLKLMPEYDIKRAVQNCLANWDSQKSLFIYRVFSESIIFYNY